jgi:hypothetical protein
MIPKETYKITRPNGSTFVVSGDISMILFAIRVEAQGTLGHNWVRGSRVEPLE